MIVRYQLPSTTHTISASASAGGIHFAERGGYRLCRRQPDYTITPDSGYYIFDVEVDGVSQGSAVAYTFSNVTSDHTITATFAALPASGGGTITRDGDFVVHTFTSGGTFAPVVPVNAEVLVVAGGGGGGRQPGTERQVRRWRRRWRSDDRNSCCCVAGHRSCWYWRDWTWQYQPGV